MGCKLCKSCKSMWIRHFWNTSHIPNGELARTLFSLEYINNIKIEIAHKTVIEDGCI